MWAVGMGCTWQWAASQSYQEGLRGAGLRGWVTGETREMTTWRSHRPDVNTEQDLVRRTALTVDARASLQQPALSASLSPTPGFCRHSLRLNRTNRSPKMVKKEWLCKQLLFFHIHPRHTHLSLIHSKPFIIGMNVR